MKATNIEWDYDGEYINENNELPYEMDIPLEIIQNVEIPERYEAVSEYLTEQTGFTHYGFKLEISSKEIQSLYKDKPVTEKEYQDTIKFLKDEIEKHCNSDKCYEMYFDYNDTIGERTLAEIYSKYSPSSEETFPIYFEQAMCENYMDATLDTESELFKTIEQDAYNDPNISSVFEKTISQNDMRELMEEAGYTGVTYDIEDVIGSYKINVMFATEAEQNYDMSSIVDAYMGERTRLQERELDNALTYLIHQQGHTVEEVLNAIDEINRIADDENTSFKDIEAYGEKGFVESVAYEIYNNPTYSMSELTALVSINGMDGLETLNALTNKEGNIVISKDASIGLYNEWQGSGSMLEIQLEKPLIVPADMVRNVQIEGQKSDYTHGYTVNDTYGLISECWKGSVDKTTEQPELIQENITATISKFKERSEKSKSQNIER